MYFGKPYLDTLFTVTGRVLANVDDKGRLTANTLFTSLKICSIASSQDDKDTGMLTLINQSIQFRSLDFMLQLYKVLMGLHLEYYVVTLLTLL